jgi:ABC-2 type transport system permease protein
MHYFESIQGMELQYKSGLRPALNDLWAGFKNKSAWWLISRHQIQTKYRRTILGSWWITIQRLVFVAGLTYIFGSLMGKELGEFVAHVATGFIIFGTITTTLTSGATLLTSNANLLKNSAMPISIVNYRNFASNLIQLAHDLIALTVVLIIFNRGWSPSSFWALLGLVLVLTNMFLITLWIAPFAARFRDVAPIVNALSSILMFITPIFWQIEDLDANERDILTAWNPFTYLLETVRAPLLGDQISMSTWWIASGFTLANLIIGVIVFSATRNRIRYWV